MTDNVNDSTSSTSAWKPLPVVLTIDYRNHSETLTVALPATLGRDQEADVCLRDPWISHIHCSLDEIDGTVVVRDLDSKNGIFFNGLRVVEALLRPGDCFTLGVTEITMEHRASASEAAARATAIPPQLSIPDARDLPNAVL